MTNIEPWPTEGAMTAALDAAAAEYRLLALKDMGADPADVTDWADLDGSTKHVWASPLVSIVHKALTAIEDPRYAAFERGVVAQVTAAETPGLPVLNPYQKD